MRVGGNRRGYEREQRKCGYRAEARKDVEGRAGQSEMAAVDVLR